MPRTPARMIGALGRSLDGAVCAGAVANAARAVHADELRAGQRRDAMAAVRQMQSMPPALMSSPRRSSQLAG